MRAGEAVSQHIACIFQISGRCTVFTRAGPDIATYGYASPEIPGKVGIAIGCLSVHIYADYAEEVQMHLGSAILVIWLVIGGFAAGQRGDYKGSVNCSRAATAAVTILAGPLNYTGVNPHINCTVRHPSN
jgi:hypothetical protein